MVAIRDAQEGDVARIVDLLIEMGYAADDLGHVPAFVADLSVSRTDRVFVADEDGIVAGFISVAFSDLVVHPPRSCRVIAIAVTADRRRHGIGAALLRAGESAAREAGCERIELTAMYENTGALAFYRQAGWTETGPRFKLNF